MTLTFDEACAKFNSLGENGIISYYKDELSREKMQEISNLLEQNEYLKEAFEGFKLLVDKHPNESFNNFFQQLKEDFVTRNALRSALKKNET